MTLPNDNILKALGEVMTDILAKGDQIAIPAFGSLRACKIDEHVDTDPATGNSMLIPPAIKVEFTPALKLVKQIKNGHHE